MTVVTGKESVEFFSLGLRRLTNVGPRRDKVAPVGVGHEISRAPPVTHEVAVEPWPETAAASGGSSPVGEVLLPVAGYLASNL